VDGLKAPLMQVDLRINPVSFGWLGIFSAVSVVFFRVHRLRRGRDRRRGGAPPATGRPRGILGSLAVCTVL